MPLPGKESQMKRCLYLGLDPTRYVTDVELVHCPLIRTEALPKSRLDIRLGLAQIPEYTHVLFSSRVAVTTLWNMIDDPCLLKRKQILCVGKATGKKCDEIGLAYDIAPFATAEGMIEALKQMDLTSAFLFWPHSALSRPVLGSFLQVSGIRHYQCDLYQTSTRFPDPLPTLTDFHEIIFTSPSTVEAFDEVFGHPPSRLALKAIGPVTQARLKEKNWIT